jgi:hypothetical protein
MQKGRMHDASERQEAKPHLFNQEEIFFKKIKILTGSVAGADGYLNKTGIRIWKSPLPPPSSNHAEERQMAPAKLKKKKMRELSWNSQGTARDVQLQGKIPRQRTLSPPAKSMVQADDWT